jgi:hypothetical protein
MRAPVTPPSSILFDYSVMGEKGRNNRPLDGVRVERERERERYGGRGTEGRARGTDETKGRHEVGRYKW